MRKKFSLIYALSIFLSTAFGELPILPVCDQNLKDPISLEFLKSIDNIFKNNMCSSAGEIKLKSELDKNHCAAINKCADSLISLASENEKYEAEYLDLITLQEGFNRLLRNKLVQTEYTKYAESIPQKFRQKRLTYFIENLPKEVQSKINKSQPKTTENLCGKIAKSTGMYLSDSAFLNARADLFEHTRNLHLFGNFDPDKIAFSASIINSMSEDSTGFSGVYQTLKREEERVFIEESLYDENRLIENFYFSIKEQIAAKPNMSESDFSELTSKTLRIFADAHNDVLFKVSQEELKKHMPLSKKDFISGLTETKKNLIEKYRAAHISLANENYKQNCETINLSIDNVCSNIQKKLSEIDQLKFLKDNSNAKEQIIEFLENENGGSDIDFNKSLARLKSKESNFHTQFIMDQKLEVCQSLYPIAGVPSQQEISNKAIKARLIENLDQNFEGKASERHTIAKRDVKELIKNSPAISNALIAREKSFESIPKNPAASEVAKINKLENKAANPVAENAKKMDNSNNDFAKAKAAMNSSKSVPGTPPSFPSSDIEANMETEFLNKKLKAKITDLEKKEKESSVIKKQNISGPVEKEKEKDKEREKEKDENPVIVDGAKAKRLEDLEALKKQVSTLKSESEKSNTIENSKRPEDTSVSKNNGSNTQTAFFGKNTPSDSVEESGNKTDFTKKAQESSNSFSNSSFNQPTQETAVKAPGLVLTKSESSTLKNTAVLENPKESEIENLIKENLGLPVVIMENGILMEVALIINSDKKRIFVKKALNKEKMAALNKEINMNKMAKDVSRVPTRLYNLKSLFKEKVR